MLKFSKNFCLIRRCYSTEVVTLQGTLHLRFLEHLKQKEAILKCNSNLKMMMKVFGEQPIAPHSPAFKERFKQIDKETHQLLRQGKNSDFGMIALIDELVLTMPGCVTKLKCFDEATRMLLRKFEKRPTRGMFVKLCFYFGLYKKQSPGPTLLTGLIEEHLDEILDAKLTVLSTVDFACICTAAYKASVRINSKKFTQRLIQEVVSTKEIDAHIFVAFIKSLRHNQINSSHVMEALKRLRDNKELNKLDFKSLIHVFPLIADNSILDEELSGYIVDRSIETLTEDARAKDAQKFLYSCALLKFPIKIEHLQKLEQLVMARTEHKEFHQKFDNFVDVALSMWMLNFRSRDLIDRVMMDSRFSKFEPQYGRVKIDSRKKLLQTCVEIEEPEWIRFIEIPTPSFNENRQAPGFLVKSSIEKAMMELRGKDVKIVQQIRNLNIAGILLKEDGSSVHIEVLDNTNSLSDGKSPNGIFGLKLRLLKEKGFEVRVVSKMFIFY